MTASLFLFLKSKPAPAAGSKPLAAAFAETGAPAVTTADYEAAAVAALAGLKAPDLRAVAALALWRAGEKSDALAEWRRLGANPSALAARDRLLALRVPAADRDAHFALVSKLTAYAAALNGGTGAEKIWNELKAAAEADQWLKTAAPFQSQ